MGSAGTAVQQAERREQDQRLAVSLPRPEDASTDPAAATRTPPEVEQVEQQHPLVGREGKDHRSARAQAAVDRGARTHTAGTTLTVVTTAAMHGAVAAMAQR